MLICAKTKVAPIKQQTIPRLELCGAVLLTKLIKRVSDNLNIPIERVFCYSDSTIVLGWLSKDPGSWQVFVSNRVAQIIDILPAHHWIHVVTSENPADSASRSIRVSNFLNNTLWLNGPPWLSASTYIPKIYNGFQTDELPERRKINYFQSVLVGLELNNRFSSYIKWIRVNATIIRFIKNCRLVRTNRHYGELSIDELDNSLIAILKDCQSRHFPSELQSLIDQKLIKPKGSITALSPFLDKDNLLRVGGRLEHSTLPYERRHPTILHAKDHFVELYIRHIHQKYFHVGPIFIMNFVKQRYWIVGGIRRVVKKVIWTCTTCIRYRGKTNSPQMGQLPSNRVIVQRPFSCIGIDYAGPIITKTVGPRSTKTFKSYIAFFVCFAVKAIHIELVTDMTTATFIAAFRRFVSRRGLPSVVYSDNGRNFVGFQNLLNSKEISTYASQEGIKWHFIPPRTPHFGGLWEAAVKSAKYYLVRVIGNQIYNFEEYATLLTQIEAILNSRPLCVISNRADDLDMLTPAHFLTGSSILSLPDKLTESRHVGFLRRWEHLQQLLRSFWRKWCLDYLNHLQSIHKWNKEEAAMDINNVVIIKEDNTPPSTWCLGRIVRDYPGDDGHVRVYEVLTKNGTLRRPARKLIPLVPSTT